MTREKHKIQPKQNKLKDIKNIKNHPVPPVTCGFTEMYLSYIYSGDWFIFLLFLLLDFYFILLHSIYLHVFVCIVHRK